MKNETIIRELETLYEKVNDNKNITHYTANEYSVIASKALKLINKFDIHPSDKSAILAIEESKKSLNEGIKNAKEYDSEKEKVFKDSRLMDTIRAVQRGLSLIIHDLD